LTPASASPYAGLMSGRISLIAACILLISAFTAAAQEFSAPSYRTEDGRIIVDARLDHLPDSFIADINNGIEKRIEYHADLMRQWSKWMDEYVSGETIIRTIKFDVTTKQYSLKSVEERYVREKTAKDLREAVEWLTTIKGARAAVVGEVQRGTYYVRVRAEARRPEIPLVFKALLFFMPEIEFSAETVSPAFPLNK